jgi:hypothetical protein
VVKRVVACLALATSLGAAQTSWKPLGAGVEYTHFQDAGLHVVRIDPARARLRALAASGLDRKQRTAAEWCDQHQLVAAINLGMYLDDHLSNVGHARLGAHHNQKRWHPQYQSVLVFGPRKPGIPAAAMLDLDVEGARQRADHYENAIQNLRLIRAPGANVWSAQPRRWSEAAIAVDKAGRVLFVFSRAPHTMVDFNRILLALPLDVTAAMHAEGGPEASLSVRGAVKLDLNGSFETGFVENDLNRRQWSIPNVLGVAK